MPQLVIDRRTFLKAAGLTAAGVAGAERALGAARPAGTGTVSPAQLADDPITAQAAALGFDQDAIFRFVADEVQYEPYAGVLRGNEATLAGRAGNSADKARLLAALLRASLIDVRYVMGTLDDAAADALAGTTVDADTVRERARLARDGAIVTAPSGPAPDPSPEMRAIIDRIPEIEAAAIDWAARTVDANVRTIVDALSGAGVAVPSGATSALPELERTRHLWVQAASGSEWVDLDPTILGSEAGRTVATPSGDPLTTLPDDLRHRIDIALIGEHVAGDALVQETLLEHSVFADQLTDVPIAIGHAKPEGLAGAGVNISSMLTGGVRYQPVLQVGDTAYISETGLLISGDASDPFGAGGSDREGEATGEWLELRISAPDGSVSTARRTLFDRVGEVARQSGGIDVAAIPVAELADLGPDETREYLPLRAARFLAVATGAQARPILGDGEGSEARALGLAASLYHMTRDAIDTAVALDRGIAVHLTAPNVVMHSYEIAPGPANGTWSVMETDDLLHRGFGMLPVQGSSGDLPGGIVAGVASHVAERVQAGEGLPADLAPAAPGLSAGAIIERAVADGITLRVLQGSVPPDLGLSPDVIARLGDTLAQGWVAIGPGRPVRIGDQDRVGWWLVDPRTGATIDMLDDGRGAAISEEVAVLLMVGSVAWGMILVLLAQCVRDAYRTVSEVLAAHPGAGVGDVALKRFACGN